MKCIAHNIPFIANFDTERQMKGGHKGYFSRRSHFLP